MGYSEGSFRPVPGALRRACATLIVALVSSVVVGQGGALAPPGPDEPAWGAYRAGLGYPVFSDDLQERAAYEGIDPRCLMTITIAWEAHPRIVANEAAGLLEVLVEGVSRAEAQAVLMDESPYFNADIDCVGSSPTPPDGAAAGAGTCSGAIGGTVAGNWDWFNRGVVTFDPSGSVFSGDEIVAWWQCEGSEVVVTWGEPPTFRDRLTLSPDGRELTGEGKEIDSGRVSHEGRFATR